MPNKNPLKTIRLWIWQILVGRSRNSKPKL